MDVKVELIDFTGCGSDDEHWYAARKLAFTKNTRLQMDPYGFQRYLEMPVEEIQKELSYMVATIRSSWEFARATFCIRNVSRACAQQITRTRWTPMEADIFGSYAMQTQRILDVREMGTTIPETLPEEHAHWYIEAMDAHRASYIHALELGIAMEDARGLLPMNTQCNLVAEWDLRALADLLVKRDSARVQGEFQEVVRQMRILLLRQWPWVEPFLEPKNKAADEVLRELADEIAELAPMDLKFKTTKELLVKLTKARDLIRSL